MTLTRDAAALAFGIGLTFASGPLALAAGADCPQRTDQEQYRNPPSLAEKAGQQQLGQNTSEDQKADQEQSRNPPFLAERAGQQQLGKNTGEAQKADQEQSGTQVASNCR